VRLPVSQPTSCAFGGEGLRTLYVTTATQTLNAVERAEQPLAGALLALDVGVAGLPEPMFAG
jgi:sugar lactone lactonase YvrE